MNRQWTNRSKVLVGLALIVVVAAVTASQDGGFQMALFLATVAYSLLIVGVAVATVFLFRGGSRRTKQAMAAGVGVFAVLAVIGVATSSDGRAIFVIVDVWMGMAVVCLVVLGVRFGQRRRHGLPSQSPRT